MKRQLSFVLMSLAFATCQLSAQENESRRGLHLRFEMVGTNFVPFTIVGEIPQEDARIREIVRCLSNMPPRHQKVIPPIFIVPQLAGTRTTGGGYYQKNAPDPDDNLRVWLGRSARTGIPDSVIQEVIDSSDLGIIALTHSRFSASQAEPHLIHHFTALHEAAHAVQQAIGSVVPIGTAVSDLAQVYGRSDTIKEHSAEAYSRYIVSPSNICRSEVHPDGSARSACTARVRDKIRASAAFESAIVPADWRPKANCSNNAELDSSFSTPVPSKSETGDGSSKSGGSTTKVARIPSGKGLFYQPRDLEISNRISAADLAAAEITWIAVPIRSDYRNQMILQNFTDLVDEFVGTLAEQGQVYVWRGYAETNGDAAHIASQASDLISAAIEFKADGIIVDPEGPSWDVSRQNPLTEAVVRGGASALMTQLRTAAAEHGWSIGVTSYANFANYVSFEEFYVADFVLPQFYNRFQRAEYNDPAEFRRGWSRAQLPIVAIAGAHKRVAGAWKGKTDEEVRRLAEQIIAAASPPPTAMAWWSHYFVREGDTLDAISAVTLP